MLVTPIPVICSLLPQVPAVVARLSQVLPLVSVLGDRRAEAATRMYALLVLARLANHSPECQMDAVRVSRVWGGGERALRVGLPAVCHIGSSRTLTYLPAYLRAACLMVQEGAIGPLLALVRRGSEEEQTHACRLLAILAQAVPTHGRFKELGVRKGFAVSNHKLADSRAVTVASVGLSVLLRRVSYPMALAGDV